MSISELVSGMDRAEVELLAGEIVARLEGRTVSAGAEGPGEEEKRKRAAQLLETLRTGSSARPEQPETERGKRTEAPEREVYLSLRREVPEERGTADERKTLSNGQRVSGRGSGDMQSISDFFMRDSRRYDSGFERY